MILSIKKPAFRSSSVRLPKFSECSALVALCCLHYLVVSLPWATAFSMPSPPALGAKFVIQYTLTDDQDETIGKCTQWKVPNPEDEDELEMFYPTARSLFLFGNDTTQVPIRTTSFGCGKLGYEVWPSSVCMAIYCHSKLLPTLKSESTKIVELGAGCGLPSSTLARHEAETTHSLEVVATDFWSEPDDAFDSERLVPEVYHGVNLKYNVQSEQNKNAARAERLDWHYPTKIPADWVIGSDIIYYPQDIAPLWNTLDSFLNQGAKVVVIATKDKQREALPDFMKILEEKRQSNAIKVDTQVWTLYEGSLEEERGEKAGEFFCFCLEEF